MASEKSRKKPIGTDTPAARHPSDDSDQDLRAFSNSLPMSLLRARETVMQHFRKALRTHGVTEQQWRVIRAISEAGELDVNELVRRTLLLGPSLSRILRALEISGHIKRRIDADDQRRHVLSLTGKGDELMRQHAPQSRYIYQQIAHAYGPEKLELLQSMLIDLEHSLNNTFIRTDIPTDTKKGAYKAAPSRAFK
ncbi:homoprotocatechuate degradation operon regulator HpaR [Bordetella petrii]|nr:homoprotocatechuate degradation operon regulator HpaR [Bordetella petrii]